MAGVVVTKGMVTTIHICLGLIIGFIIGFVTAIIYVI